MIVANSLRLRYATPLDNRLLADLGAETFADTFAPDNSLEDMAAYLAHSFSPQKQAQELADPASRFLIAELDEAVVGFARLHFGPAPDGVAGSRPMEISRIYARKAWIGKGIGARLMQACLDEAARENCDVVWLSVWQRNPRAIAFYRQWGFVEAGTLTFQLGADSQTDWLMVRPVRLDWAGPPMLEPGHRSGG
jgi:GNAT superfamily N-acetyltransferase